MVSSAAFSPRPARISASFNAVLRLAAAESPFTEWEAATSQRSQQWRRIFSWRRAFPKLNPWPTIAPTRRDPIAPRQLPPWWRFTPPSLCWFWRAPAPYRWSARAIRRCWSTSSSRLPRHHRNLNPKRSARRKRKARQARRPSPPLLSHRSRVSSFPPSRPWSQLRSPEPDHQPMQGPP